MKSGDIINISIALFLTASGIILGQSSAWAYLLIIISVVLLVVQFRRHLLSRLPKIYTTQESATKAVSQIYDLASEEGGQLIATHIRPRKLSPREDIAVEKLKKVKGHVEYKRFLLIEDKQSEEEWLKNTLQQLDPKIETTVYTVKSFALTPALYWAVIPRANILLYNKEKTYICMLGLDRLQTTERKYMMVNFAIEFRNANIFHTLSGYFQSITASRYVRPIQSLREYELAADRKHLKLEAQSVINTLVNLGEESPPILHIGLFGKLAPYLNGIQKIDYWEDPEADIDIMIIVERGKVEEVRKRLQETFSSEKIQIVWGDDIGYFYHFRQQGKITIDIEIHEKGTDFYERHALLGCSIFAHYKLIYMLNERGYIQELLKLHDGFTSQRERFDTLVIDRKGLLEFKERLRKDSAEVDPRRTTSICIKNLAWAISGRRPLNTDVGMRLISEQWREIFPSVTVSEVREFMLKSQEECRKKYVQNKNFSEMLVDDALKYASVQISRQ